jgi:hypothetical protein
MRRCAGFTTPSAKKRAKKRVNNYDKELVAAVNGPYIKQARGGRRSRQNRELNLAMHEH